MSESSLTQPNQSILAKAFRGELVPQDPRDEPASELLARIRATTDENPCLIHHGPNAISGRNHVVFPAIAPMLRTHSETK